MKAALGRAYAKSQKKHEANEMLNELNELAKQQYVSAYELATIYVALGNNEQAFQLLAKAYAEHSFHLVNLNVSPQFKPSQVGSEISGSGAALWPFPVTPPWCAERHTPTRKPTRTDDELLRVLTGALRKKHDDNTSGIRCYDLCWTPLRGEPCFEQIVASLVPKGNSVTQATPAGARRNMGLSGSPVFKSDSRAVRFLWRMLFQRFAVA